MTEKAAERSKMIIRLGQLLAPLQEMTERSSPPTQADYRIVSAQFELEFRKWHQQYADFGTFGDVRFKTERIEANQAWRNLESMLKDHSKDPSPSHERFKEQVLKNEEELLRLIECIPVEWLPALNGPQTPFTVSLMIEDAISTAKTRVDYIDRYLDPDFFPLYLRKLSRDVAVTLVTTPGNSSFGVQSITAISKRAEKEFVSFKLIECSPKDIHDRNLRVDDTIFHLGPSSKDAGDHPNNFGTTDSSSKGHKVIDDIIACGSVVPLR